jgi:hypothetical protein
MPPKAAPVKEFVALQQSSREKRRGCRDLDD